MTTPSIEELRKTRRWRPRNDLCRIGRGIWRPHYYRGANGKLKQVHPFRRAAPCVCPPIFYRPLAQIRMRQVRERLEARHKSPWHVPYFRGWGATTARLRSLSTKEEVDV